MSEDDVKNSEAHKTKGNELFMQDHFREACEEYSKAIDLVRLRAMCCLRACIITHPQSRTPVQTREFLTTFFLALGCSFAGAPFRVHARVQTPENHILYANRAACYAQKAMDRYDEALADAIHCVELAPTWVKGKSCCIRV